MRRKFLVALGGSLLLQGCSTNQSVKTLKTALSSQFGDASSFAPDYPEKLPYASMAVRFPNLPRALLVLGKAEGGELHWYSADRGVLVTRYGRLVRSAGFAENLVRTEFSGKDFLEPGGLLMPDDRLQRRIDLQGGARYGIAVNSSLRLGGEADVVVGQRSLRLLLVEEHCQVPTLNWSFVNKFWVDQNRFVWRSEQQIAPEFPMVQTEVMKPYLG